MTLNYWDMCNSVLRCALMYKIEYDLGFSWHEAGRDPFHPRTRDDERDHPGDELALTGRPLQRPELCCLAHCSGLQKPRQLSRGQLLSRPFQVVQCCSLNVWDRSPGHNVQHHLADLPDVRQQNRNWCHPECPQQRGVSRVTFAHTSFAPRMTWTFDFLDQTKNSGRLQLCCLKCQCRRRCPR